MPKTDLSFKVDRLGKLASFNLAFGAALVLSAVIPIGVSTLNALELTSLTRALKSDQRIILLAITGYWLPAVLIFIVLRLTKLSCFLKTSKTSQTIILTANILILLFVVVRALAATVPGGGMGFIVASYSKFVFIPVWILLAAGFSMVAYNSLKPIPLRKNEGSLNSSVASEFIFGVTLIILPLAYIATFPINKMISLSNSFSSLCDSAEIVVIEPATGTKSVFLDPDSFTSITTSTQAATRPVGEFLLNQSFLEFVERPASKRSGLKGKAQYERISIAGKRILKSVRGSTAQTQFVYEPIHHVTAEYKIVPTLLNIESSEELKLGGSRIDIRRRVDDHLIAYAQYYWNNTEFQVCPQEVHNGLFFYHFITGALGVKNPEVP
jgi:hypothetical protein